MTIKLSVNKIRGVALIWFRRKYHAIWLEWANGAQMLPTGRMRTLWMYPRIRYVHT